jgi:gluconokinase
VRDQIFDGKLSYDEITALASKVAPGADGLLFHPYLGGERAPLWDANARGSFFGLNYGHNRSQMTRSVLEGVVFNLYMVALSLIEVVGNLNMIQATGGFTSSELWTQILADIFEQPINVPESREAGCLGAVIMAEKALGIVDNLEVIEEMVGTNRSYEPQVEHFEIYRELAPIFIRLSRALTPEYQNISNFQRRFED